MVRGRYMSHEMEQICGQIMLHRKQQKVSQMVMGEELGMTQQGYQQKETNGNFRMNEFFKICSVLKLDPAELVREATR